MKILHAPHYDTEGAALCLRFNAKHIATAKDQREGRRVTCKACVALLPEAAAQVIARAKRLEVVETATGKTVKVIDVEHLSERSLERAISGLLRNMNRDGFHVRECP